MSGLRYSPLGDIWRWNGTQWTVVNVSSDTTVRNNIVPNVGPTTKIITNDLFLQAPNTEQVHQQMYWTVTNDDCVPWYIDTHVEVTMQLGVDQGDRYTGRLQRMAINTANFTGGGRVQADGRSLNVASTTFEGEITMHDKTVLSVGNSLVFAVETVIEMIDNNNPEVQVFASINNLRGRQSITRVRTGTII